MRPAFVFIFMVVVLDMLALGLMVPVLPKLMIQFEAGNHAMAAHMTGIFSFSWALMQFVASPVLGSLSDRFGRRPVLLLSCAGMGLDYMAMAVAPNLGWLFLGRLVSGITCATFATCSAYIADITPPEQRAGRYGMLGAGFGIGFVVGPALGGVLGQHSLRLPFWVAAAFSLANALYGFFVLPESLPPDRRAPFRWAIASPWGALQHLEGMKLPVLASFFHSLAHESLPSMFVLYTDYRFHWDEKTVGLVLGAIGVCSMLVSAGLTRPLVGRLGEVSTLQLGLLCGAAGFLCYGGAPGPRAFLAGVPLIALWGLAGPSLQGWLSGRIGPERQGQLQGALSSVRGMAGMLGPVLFTESFAFATRHSPMPVGTPYLLAGALLATSLALVWLSSRAGGTGAGGELPESTRVTTG